MTYKKGRCPTEAAGTAEIVHILPSGSLVVVHENGMECVHYPDGIAGEISEKYNLKPQREEYTCWLYRYEVSGYVFASADTPDKLPGAVVIGSALLVEGVHVPQAKLRVTSVSEGKFIPDPPDYYNGEWHDWHGEECPVPDARRVETESTAVCTWSHHPSACLWSNVRRFRVIRGPQP